MNYDRYYNILTTAMQKAGQPVTDPLCNAVTVLNVGTSIAYVNGIPLNPGQPGVNNGESITFGGNRGEYFEGLVQITFPPNTPGNSVIVIQKIYLAKC